MLNKFNKLSNTKSLDKESFNGSPSVKINRKPIQKSKDKYNFVTSILIESEQGTNEPIYINSSQELIDIYGDIITKDMKYCLSFLTYSPSLLVQRTFGQKSYNASTKNFPSIKINNYEDFNAFPENDFLLDKTSTKQSIRFIAQTVGAAGNFIKVSLFTVEELKINATIYSNFKAKDIIQGMDDMCYCCAVFKDNGIISELKEVFVIPFNDLESINTQSNYIYVKFNTYNEFLDKLYDGNKSKWGGNILLADGNESRFFYGYDGKLKLIDGKVVLADGNEINLNVYIYKFYNSSIIALSDGITEKAHLDDMKESCEDLNNTLNYDIDLHIGNNITLFRKDCVNIVGTPRGINQAIDFKLIFDTYTKNKIENTMFVYGTKIVDKEEINCAADIAGLKSKEVLTNGLGISTSKITKPLNILKLKTAPSIAEMDILYQNGINTVHNSKGIIYCNGEIIHQDNIQNI